MRQIGALMGVLRQPAGRAAVPASQPTQSNSFAYSPEERQWPLRHSGDFLAPSLLAEVQAWRGVDRALERGFVQPARNRSLLIECLGLVPGSDLGFDLRVVRPPEKCLIAVGANDPAGRVDAVDPVPVGVENLPAT